MNFSLYANMAGFCSGSHKWFGNSIGQFPRYAGNRRVDYPDVKPSIRLNQNPEANVWGLLIYDDEARILYAS